MKKLWAWNDIFCKLCKFTLIKQKPIGFHGQETRNVGLWVLRFWDVRVLSYTTQVMWGYNEMPQSILQHQSLNKSQ